MTLTGNHCMTLLISINLSPHSWNNWTFQEISTTLWRLMMSTSGDNLFLVWIEICSWMASAHREWKCTSIDAPRTPWGQGAFILGNTQQAFLSLWWTYGRTYSTRRTRTFRSRAGSVQYQIGSRGSHRFFFQFISLIHHCFSSRCASLSQVNIDFCPKKSWNFSKKI